MPDLVRKGQIQAEILIEIKASRRMKRGTPCIALVRLRPHDGLPEEVALAYYERGRLGIVDESTVRLVRFERGTARDVASLFRNAAEVLEKWCASQLNLTSWTPTMQLTLPQDLAQEIKWAADTLGMAPERFAVDCLRSAVQEVAAEVFEE